MKLPKKTIIFFALVGGAAYAAYAFLPDFWRGMNQAKYRQAEVTRGSIVAMVNATGTVQPVLSVSVGAFVSGPVVEVLVDFNDVVQKGELLARIDPRLYEANVARDEAVLATRQADIENITAQLQLAINDEERAIALKKENQNFISNAEMDKVKFGKLALEAQLKVAKQNVKQAEANLKTSQQNLDYTKIVSPVDGVVINRKIDPGQTLAAQFQTPEMFVVAPDLKTMYILASVDESDIGMIHQAQLNNLPVQFTVDAYRGDLFDGSIIQIRMNSTTTQNVVTYPVVVEAKNPDIPLKPGLSPGKLKGPQLKLKPGMTASLSFQVDEVKNTLRLPNAALRFYPPAQKVRPEDRHLLEGNFEAPTEDTEAPQAKLPAKEKAAGRKNNVRHVWVADGDFLKAVEVTTGLSDHKYTQIVSGDLTEGQELVTGIQGK
jgi:HlyD family secretion protein